MKKAATILALPHAVTKVIQLCSSPHANARDFLAPVTSDPAIASAILKLANSVMYSREGNISNIQEAVVRIGFRSVRNAAMTMSVFKLLAGDPKNMTFNRLWYWQHSLAVAVLARRIAANGRFGGPEDAYIAGLLHDIGKPVLDDYAHHDFHAAIREAARTGKPLFECERKGFEVHHAEVGGVLLSKWGLPKEIVEGVVRHHRYGRTDETELPDKPELAEIVSLADRIAKSLFIGNAGDFVVEEIQEETIQRLKVEPLVRDKHLPDKVNSEITEVMRTLHLDENSMSSLPGSIGRKGQVQWAISPRPLISFFLSSCGFGEQKIDDGEGSPALVGPCRTPFP